MPLPAFTPSAAQVCAAVRDLFTRRTPMFAIPIHEKWAQAWDATHPHLAAEIRAEGRRIAQ